MKTLLTTLSLLCVALCITPVGGMHESNPNHNYYIYFFMMAEVLVVASLVRIAIKNRLTDES
jgi:hypothetical protein